MYIIKVIILMCICTYGCASNRTPIKEPTKEKVKLIAPPPRYGNKIV